MADPQAVLADIRSLELQMAKDLDEAQAAAAAEVRRARDQARRLLDEATERGARKAEERHEQRLTAAATEAERIRRSGDEAAAELLADLRPRLSGLVDDMVEVVLTTADGDE